MIFDYNLIITALFTSSLGSLVRLGHDSEVEKISVRKSLMVYVCSICTGYICYELSMFFMKSWIVGVPSLILSLAAVEITNTFRTTLGFVLEKFLLGLPDILIDATRRFLNLPPRVKNQVNIQPNYEEEADENMNINNQEID